MTDKTVSEQARRLDAALCKYLTGFVPAEFHWEIERSLTRARDAALEEAAAYCENTATIFEGSLACKVLDDAADAIRALKVKSPPQEKK